ncbi:AI-2E family transporter [Bacillus tuaregi]|uniref:AI-2E family transporter n=1 Tax=Bacillus tuaregi TaxID=1816695 RepID=UPI0008F8FB06|nr:AI-2E family transporter [Bacillus tuaregi]
MNISLKWYYRLGFLLLFMIVLFIFIKLQPIWLPIIKVIFKILFPFIVAAFITYLLHPLIERIHEGGLHRGLAVFIIYFLFFGGVGYAFYKGLPEFIKQLKDLAESIPELTNQYMYFVDSIQKKTAAWPDGIQERVNGGIVSIEQRLAAILTNVINSILELVGSIFTIAIIPFISFYMLKDYLLIKKAVWYLTPRNWRQGGLLLLRDIDKSLGSYIRGQTLVCVMIGTISALLFWFFHMKYPLLLGLIIGITNIIPYFGPVIGAVPAVIIASTISVKMMIITVCIIFSMQFLEGNILSPLIVGKSLHMHPLVIMLALFGGGEIGGIPGMILSVPILAVIKVGLLHTKKHFGKKKTIDLFKQNRTKEEL